MEPVVYRITLKLNDTTKPSLAMRQGDTARRIYFRLVQDGKPYEIDPGCYAVFSAVKPDGTELFNDCVIYGDTIIYDVTEQTTAVTGMVSCELTLYDAQEQMITSPGFNIVVHKKTLPGGNVASSDEAKELRKLMSDSVGFIENCKEAAGDARYEAERAYDAANKANKAANNADNAAQRASDATQDAEDVAKTVQSKLDNGEFNGAQGPEGPKGDKGDKGDPGQNNINDDTISQDSTWSSGQISAEISDCVNYSTTQNKADSQKAQARKNMDACSFMEVVDKLCPSFTETGAVVTCEPVEGYPLQVVSGIVPKQSGSGTPSPENVRPISGHDVVKLTHCGKNLLPTVDFDSKTLQGVTATRQYDGSIIFNGTSTGWAFFKLGSVWVREGQSYTLGFVDGGGANTYQLYASGNLTCYSRQGKVTAKATSSGYTDVCFIVYEGTTVTNLVVKPQLVFGSTAIEYEPYRAGDTFTRELGQTIYGGSFHWGSGTLTNGWHLLNVKDLGTSRIILAGTGDYANIPFDQNAPAADANNRQLAICSHLPYGDTRGNNVFWLDSTGTGLRLKVDGVTTKEAYVQWIEENEPMVAYPLATTTTSQLTPQKITALAGVNTLHSDTGDTTVTGKASPATEIEKLKNAILAMGANV